MFLGGDSIRMLEYLNDVTGLKSEISALRAQVEVLTKENEELRREIYRTISKLPPDDRE